MREADKIIRGWIAVAIVFSSLHTALGLLNLLVPDRDTPPLYLALLPIALLCWSGVILAFEGKYSAARVLMWIAGIATFPLGLVMIRAGNRIKQASDTRL